MADDAIRIRIDEDPNRVIGSREHNVHVAGGVNIHRKTAVAPLKLLQPLSPEQEEVRANRQIEIERHLRESIGEPYFAAPGFILYNGDCASMMQRLAKSRFQVDLTLTSPPYNIGKEYEKDMPVERYADWCSNWMSLIHQVTSATGTFWLNLGYFEVPGKGLCVPISYLLWNRSPFYLVQEVVWAYGAGVSTKQRLSPRNEKWLYFVKDQSNYTFNLDEIRDPNVKYPNQKRNGKFRCNPMGKNPSDVWEIPKVTTGADRSSKERTAHPAQFPLAVVERIVRASSSDGQVVLDPFAGSASTGIAAAGLGRIFLGFEVREDYCRLSADRFRVFAKEKSNSAEQRSLI